MAKYIVGIDVGGTFTDLVALELETNKILVNKVPTTPEDQSIGTLKTLEGIGISPADIVRFCHGYTVGINAVLTRTGAKTGLLTTEGFRDDLDAGRGWVPKEHLFDPAWIRPHQARPLVHRRYRRGIAERIKYDGSVFRPLDEAQVRKEVEFLKKEGIESVAICFINSYINPMHEQIVRGIVNEIMPGAYVQSSEIHPIAREYERTITVVLDAYTGPIVRRYLSILEKKLQDAGYKGDILVMQMSGGYRTSRAARERTVYTLESGPVAGAVGAILYAELTGSDSLITYDVGGTSTDIGVILKRKPTVTEEWEIETAIALYLPVVDITSVGSGGGSLIYLDPVGALRVGPESAAAVPGPACYDRGGVEPTLTDAALVLGILRPQLFCYGKMPLKRELAEKALQKVSGKLGMTTIELAQAAWDIATAQIVESFRKVMIARDLIPGETKIMAFGSAGPMNAVDVARVLGIPEVIVPLYAGCHSALGMLSSEMRTERSVSVVRPIDLLGPEWFNESLARLEEECVSDLVAQGVSRDQLRTERYYYGMYSGQTWDNRIEAPPGTYDKDTIEKMKEDFHEWYLGKYGYKAPELSMIITTIEVACIGPSTTIKFPKIRRGSTKARKEALVDETDVWMRGKLVKEVPVWRRDRLLAGNKVAGPAIVDEGFATTMVGEGDVLTVDEHGVMRIKVKLA